jgi:hypothetical protein
MSHIIPTPPATKRALPGPHTLSPLGGAPAIARDTQKFAWEIWQRYGDMVHFRLLLTLHPW